MPDLSIIFDMGVVALRFLMPVYAIIIVYQCFAAMRRRRRPETPLISLLNPATGEILPVLFWENSIGRSKSSDVTVDDPTVSRNHCVLLRRKDGWYVSDTDCCKQTVVTAVVKLFTVSQNAYIKTVQHLVNGINKSVVTHGNIF